MKRLYNNIKNIWQLTGSKKRLFIVCSLMVVVLAVAIAALYVSKSKNGNKNESLPTASQAAEREIETAKQNKPSSSATADEKNAYYKDLFYAESDANNYKAAIATFSQWESATPDQLSYLDYISLARFKGEVGDKQGAIKALDKATTILPPTPNEETGYDPVSTNNLIKTLKKGYSS